MNKGTKKVVTNCECCSNYVSMKTMNIIFVK